MTDLETAEAHILALMAIVQTALPILLTRAEVETMKAALEDRLKNTPVPDDKAVAAVWLAAVDLAKGHMEEVAARAESRRWRWRKSRR